MRNKNKNALLSIAVNALFMILVMAIGALFYQTVLMDSAFVVFMGALVLSLLPLVNIAHGFIDDRVRDFSHEKLYVQTVDSILNIDRFDEMLKMTFDQILDLIKVRSGLLIFYYHDKDEFKIFYQKNRRSRIIHKAKIENANIIFRVINSADDIIIKSKLNPALNFEKQLIQEIEKLHGELVIPIYYHEMFQGLIVIGHRNLRFSNTEMRLLKIFASRIAILSINSFYFNEVLKKKEVEKEFELASKIQKRFLPATDLCYGRISISIFHETVSLMTREFYDVFENDTIEDDIRISAYRLHGDITGTSIYMPGIQALLQSYARLKYNPSQSVLKLKKNIKEREILDEEVSIFHGTIRQNGSIEYSNARYQTPLHYRKSTRRLEMIEARNKQGTGTVHLKNGDILIIACETIYSIISLHLAHFSELIREHGDLSAPRLKTLLMKNIFSKYIKDDKDKLMMLIMVREIS